jgi:predicted nucleic acid-binding protein
MPFVIDASVAIKWVVAEPGSAEALALLDANLAAPDLLIAECTNALARLVRLGMLGQPAVQTAITFLSGVPIDLVATRPLMPRALDMAGRLQHPAYDCFYLALPWPSASTEFASRRMHDFRPRSPAANGRT